VGNVAGIILRHTSDGRKNESLLTRGGVIGFRMPSIRSVCLDLAPGDSLILTSDGIRSGFMEAAPRHDTAQQLADHILAQSKRDTDDALVLVLRLLPA
jgi:negative regulator of sigma-B (phosphoserine phosphatase)